ncbi:MAG TPA: TonB-dependent receptor [Rhodanobacter sp.]|nr:TonB-dependent receptor [Rhodanobacter sp.]
MKHDMNRLSLAVRLALTVGTLAVAGTLQAQDATNTGAQPSNTQQQSNGQQPATQTPSSKAKTLQGVIVTGSLIRRVDAETSSPVVTIDRSSIDNSGKPVLGDVLQQLPSISGNATNTQNNSNGGGGASPLLEGGDGAARVSLRGLGITRTLVLIDGQRMANQDINMIPQNMIERVDVLAEGASTVYGSDAIGGVVNFILRKDYKGAEFSLNDGISSHGDGQRRGFSFTVGDSGERGNIVAGLNYNKYDSVLATKRSFSAHQLYLSSGVVSAAGSGTIPTGRIQVPASIANQYGCALKSNGTAYLTLQQGNGSSLGDYRCYGGSGDTYNYNAYNYIQTEQERTDGFVLGNYQLADNLKFFADMFYNRTVSSGQDAPAPTGVGDGWHVLSSNPINPFGVTFSANGIPGDPNSGYAFSTRLTGLGTRLHTFTTTNAQIMTGLRGNFGQSSWTWDAIIDYGHHNRIQRDYNEVNIAAFQAAIDSGVNIFNQADPSVTSALKSGVDTPVYTMTNSMRQLQLDASGDLWNLPAGTMQLSVGGLYRKQTMNYDVTSDAILDIATGNCQILQEACGSPGRGSYNVKELYAETLIPLLSNVPGAYSLNLDLGIRSSDYSTTGTTTNKKIAVEWRPIADLLVRGTVSQVFRAPNLDELYDGYTIGGPVLSDPCIGLTSAQLAQHANACQYVPPGWGGNPIAQVTSYYSGAVPTGSSLKPEHGKSVDLGFVYSPSALPGLSTSLDFWHIYLTDMLTPITAQTVANSCFANNGSPYCAYIHRYDNTSKLAGAVFYINTPVVNLGNLSTTGVDFTVGYQIPHFNLGSVNPGNFKVGLNTSYTSTYKNDATPGQPGAQTINYAGTYTQQFGNIARWRGTATLNWSLGNWSAQWQTRYIHRLTDLNADYTTGASAPMGGTVYHSIQLGYAVPAIHTRFDIGVDNLNNRIPPLVYQNGANYNVDTATYDTLGRYYWARATVKF